MHELGILRQIVKTVYRITLVDGINSVKFITLEVGELSGFVPYYLKKLYPIATDAFPPLKKAELIINMVPGKGLVIKDIGY